MSNNAHQSVDTVLAFDNFYTPANGEFYSSFKYHHLERHQQEIRLLRLLPDSRSVLREVELLDCIPLAEAQGKYSAISYCAGDPHRTRVITVNGIPFNIFANLGEALDEVCHFWVENHADEDLLVWVDQICINQSDFQERSHQVGFMQSIYHNAEQVFVCPSSDPSTGSGIYWLQRLHDDLMSNCSMQYASKKLPLDAEQLFTHFDKLSKRDDFQEGLPGFLNLIRAEWFRRAWVYQEFIVSSHTHFLCGRQSISWSILSTIFEFLFSTRQIPEMVNLWDEFVRMVPGIQEIASSEDTQKAVSSALFFVKSKAEWSGTADLKDLLNHARSCSSSDPRDRIYAFLGLADPKYMIEPDYSPQTTFADVLADTTRKIIVYENRLDVLLYATLGHRPHHSQIPSWVVDWAGTTSFVEAEMITLRKHEQSASKDTRANAAFLDDTSGIGVKLVVTGVLVHTLASTDWLDHQWESVDHDERKVLPEGKTFAKSGLTKPVNLGDQIWVVYGARSPYILRPAGSDHILVCEARGTLVSRSSETEVPTLVDLMSGFILDGVEKGECSTSQITLI